MGRGGHSRYNHQKDLKNSYSSLKVNSVCRNIDMKRKKMQEVYTYTALRYKKFIKSSDN